MRGRAGESVMERVLLALECVPSGKVASYGDLAELVGTSARRVGAVLAEVEYEVPWWRVVSADGQLPPHLLELACRHWRSEGTPMLKYRVNMAKARADLEELARAYALLVSPD